MALTAAGTANAHEVNPAYLEITEVDAGTYNIVWKQPLKDGMRLRIDPVLPDACAREGEQVTQNGAVIVSRWQTQCDLNDGIISISGLERTLTDAFVRVERLDREPVAAVLRGGANRLDLSTATGTDVLSYLWIGVEHIWFGYDHLLFVLGLVLLVRPRQLFATVTAFTVAHSLTLGLSALAGVSLPGPPVEIIIAASIALLAREALCVMRGQKPLSARAPWLIAFGFGLIHGFGFAGALSDIGLPDGAEIWALLLFNLGVELGQIAFVIVLLAVGWCIRKVMAGGLKPLQIAAAYFIGFAGTFWTIERLAETFL